MTEISTIVLIIYVISALLQKNSTYELTELVRKDSSCVASRVGSIWECQCRDIQLKNIPQNIKKEIEILSFYDGQIENLYEDSFKIYNQIRILIFYETEVQKLHSTDFLKVLKKLQTVFLFKSSIPSFPNYTWPSSIELMNFTNMELTEFDLTKPNLPNLRLLNLESNSLTKFPALNYTYPFEAIILDNNPDIRITAENLIPYCRLRYLGVNLFRNQTRNTNGDGCSCFRLKLWLKREKIQNNFDKHLCDGLSGNGCSYEFDDELLKMRHNCYLGFKRKKFNFFWILISCALVLLLFAIIGLITLLHHYRIKKKSDQGEHNTGKTEERSSGSVISTYEEDEL